MSQKSNDLLYLLLGAVYPMTDEMVCDILFLSCCSLVHKYETCVINNYTQEISTYHSSKRGGLLRTVSTVLSNTLSHFDEEVVETFGSNQYYTQTQFESAICEKKPILFSRKNHLRTKFHNLAYDQLHKM